MPRPLASMVDKASSAQTKGFRGRHHFIAPDSSPSRSPCRALNTVANHVSFAVRLPPVLGCTLDLASCPRVQQRSRTMLTQFTQTPFCDPPDRGLAKWTLHSFMHLERRLLRVFPVSSTSKSRVEQITTP